MPRINHRFVFPDRFVAGTVGQPGQRTFFLQARQANRLVSVVCEKQQVEVLADHDDALLEKVEVCCPGQGQRGPGLGCVAGLDEAEMDGLVAVGGVGVAAAEEMVRASHGEAHGVLGAAGHQLQPAVL